MPKASLIDKFLMDNKGKIAIMQMPNVPLLAWIVLSLIKFFVHNGNFKNGLEYSASAILITWAYLEITSGVSYFRRLLGVVVFSWTILSYFR